MVKQYAIEILSWAAVFIAPIVIAWLGTVLAKALNRLAPKVVEAVEKGIDHAIEWSRSELIKRALEEVKALIGPIIIRLFSTASKQVLKDLADRKITREEAQASLKLIGAQAKDEIRVATAEWKKRMSPYLGDTDKLIESVTEELYELVKRNFQERNSELAPASAPAPAVPPSK